MTQHCPDFEMLTSSIVQPGLSAHVHECATCRALLVLARGQTHPRSPRTAECDAIEPLIAAVTSGAVLELADEQLMQDHIDRCDRCAATACAVMLERDDDLGAPGEHTSSADNATGPAALPRPIAASPWSPAVEPGRTRVLRRRRRLVGSAAAVTIAAAAAALAIAAFGDDDTGSAPPARQAAASENSAEQTTGSAPTESQPSDQPTFAVPDQPPSPTDDEDAQVLLDEARQAALAGHYSKALRYCEMSLELRPGDQGAIQTCAVASCKLKSASRSKRYLRQIDSDMRRHQLRQICLQAGVTDL